MKKRYISPLAEIIELGIFNLIAISIPENNDNWANEYDASNYRSDWENIWANM